MSRQNAGVLVVEDEPIIALHLQVLLEELGFTDIRLAHDLGTATALLRERTPDLAILDINLGRQLVYPLAIEIRRRGIPFAFATGRMRSEILSEWARIPIIAKPLTKQSMEAAIHALGFAVGDAGLIVPDGAQLQKTPDESLRRIAAATPPPPRTRSS